MLSMSSWSWSASTLIPESRSWDEVRLRVGSLLGDGQEVTTSIALAGYPAQLADSADEQVSRRRVRLDPEPGAVDLHLEQAGRVGGDMYLASIDLTSRPLNTE